MKYVEKPHFPQNARTILVGKKYYTKLVKAFECLGIQLISVPDNPFVDERLSGHADLSVVHLGGNKIALAPYLKGTDFAKYLLDEGFELMFSERAQSGEYPLDAALNFCICGEKVIYNPQSADDMIVQYLTSCRGYKPVVVKQGYTKCSVCTVDERGIVSSDSLIHKSALEEGLDSLKILPGFVSLPGFEYGFLGGAAFKISENKLAFTGVLDEHPNKNDILKFLCLHNVEPVYITRDPVFDIGSAIPIIEK